MSHLIRKREDIGKALLRLVRHDLAAARTDLSSNGGREERIHRVRQRLKRVRTLFRVIEPELGDRASAARHAMASTARLLARTRDADVVAASARGLASEITSPAEIGLDRVVEALDREAAQAHQAKTPNGEVDRRLAALEADVAEFDADTLDGARLLDLALSRAYGDGRRSMRRAQTSLATPDLHRWRKHVKHYWHLLRLARRRLKSRQAKVAAKVEQLGQILGQDHDHALLAEKLALSPEGDPALMRQLALIAARRRALEAEAFDLGASLYGDKPREFARRLRLK